jgi:hypothetical protein
MSRGLENNNPGNLIKGDTLFLGEKPESTDERFRQFETLEYGYRALLKNLISYINKGYDTISKIINRWAPASENQTIAYINNVEKWTGIYRDTSLSVNDKTSLIKLAGAISLMENGVKPVTSKILKGWDLLNEKKK